MIFFFQYPEFFSMGFFSHKGPIEEEMENIILHVTFNGNGWDNKKLTEIDHTKPPNKTMKMKVRLNCQQVMSVLKYRCYLNLL